MLLRTHDYNLSNNNAYVVVNTICTTDFIFEPIQSVYIWFKIRTSWKTIIIKYCTM